MELKTKIIAEENKQEITVLSEFDLPVNLLFMAYIEPKLLNNGWVLKS